MCSLYANCRRERCATKFQDIIECYEEINPNNKEQHDDIIKRIDNRPQGHEPVNLIGFYNSHFIVAMKEFVLGLTHRPV